MCLHQGTSGHRHQTAAVPQRLVITRPPSVAGIITLKEVVLTPRVNGGMLAKSEGDVWKISPGPVIPALRLAIRLEWHTRSSGTVTNKKIGLFHGGGLLLRRERCVGGAARPKQLALRGTPCFW